MKSKNYFLKNGLPKLLGLILLSFVFQTFAFAQVNNDQILNYKIDKNTFTFDGDLDFSVHDFIYNHRDILNLGNGDSLIYGGFEADSLYFVRIKFYQYHLGVPVDKIWALFMEKDNRVYSL